MKVLVTGCFGFIGSHVVTDLLNSGHEVLGFDDLSNPSIQPTNRIKASVKAEEWAKFKFYRVDVRSLQQMLAIVAAESPTAIVHLAAMGSIPKCFLRPHECMAINAQGFANMCTLAELSNVKRFVYASSSSVYGRQLASQMLEGIEGQIVNPYALSKKLNEDWARVVLKVPHLGLRFFNVYGPGQRFDSGLSAVIPRWLNADKIMINGEGDVVRDFTYVKDVAQAVSLALGSAHYGKVYNVGTGVGTSLTHLSECIEYLRGQVEITRSPTHKRAGETLRSVASTVAAERDLKFKASYSLARGLLETWEYYKRLMNEKDSKEDAEQGTL